MSIPSSVILVVDNNQDNRERLLNQLSAEFGDKHKVMVVPNAKEAILSIDSEHSENITVIAVDLSLGGRNDAKPGLRLISNLRAKCANSRILAYSLLPLGNIEAEAVREGANRFIHADNVALVTTQIILEKELVDLRSTSPLVNKMLNGMNVGISVHDTDYSVVWANELIRKHTRTQEVAGKVCWKRYHNFQHRECPCAGCVAADVITSARKKIAALEPVGEEVGHGIELLPIDGKIQAVEVDTAAFPSSDKRMLVAVVETVRFIEKEWEQQGSAFERYRRVMKVAREMGAHRDDAPPFRSVSILYRPKETQAFHLFHFENGSSEPGTAKDFSKLEHLDEAYRECLQGKTHKFVRALPPRNLTTHFLWPPQADTKGDLDLVLDVAYHDIKPDGLLVEDLAPYWRYLGEHFENARKSRDEKFARDAEDAVEEFIAKAIDKEHMSEKGGDAIIQLAVECVRKALNPLSMHIRTVERETNRLEKRDGFGTYYDLAPLYRKPGVDDTGSPRSVNSREDIWAYEAHAEEIVKNLYDPISEEQMQDLARITSFVTLPLVVTRRVLGTLSMQFADDSLFSDAKRSFIKRMASALTSALGRFAWAKERVEIAQYFRKVDEEMFNPKRDLSTEDGEKLAIASAAEMVFKLTYAEAVLYYRHDSRSHVLRFMPDSQRGTYPEGTAIPAVLPEGVGVIGKAVKDGKKQLVSDYQSPEWSQYREALYENASNDMERRAMEWIGGTIVAPVVVDGKAEGALAAMTPARNWLTEEDAQIVDEFAAKAGLRIKASRVQATLNRELDGLRSFMSIQAGMARATRRDVLDRLFLLAVSAGECLGFSRAVLFLRCEGSLETFKAVQAVGHTSLEEARACWDKISDMSLDQKIFACSTKPVLEFHDSLADCAVNREISLDSEIVSQLSEGAVLASEDDRRSGIASVGQILAFDGKAPAPYVMASVITGEAVGGLIGFVLADRAFLPHTEIPAEDRDLLKMVSTLFGIMLKSFEHRFDEEKNRERLVWGMSYALRTRAAALEAHLSRLRKCLSENGDWTGPLSGIERASEFFKRAGTLAARHLRTGRVGAPHGEELDLNEVCARAAAHLGLSYLAVESSVAAPRIVADRTELENALLELFFNARDFADKVNPCIHVKIAVEGGHARVDTIDNGEGVHPALRDDLFKEFKCYPANRLGLGLSYAKRVIEAYDGTIQEVGQKGAGAHFVVTLPLIRKETT